MQSELKKLIKLGESSPCYQLLNMEIEEVRKVYTRLSIKIDKRHIQFLKTVHGGVITSLADSVAAWAIYGSNNLEGILVTIEMKINFLKPIKSGKLIADVGNIHRGSKIFISDINVRVNKSALIAKSLLTYYLVKDESQHKLDICLQ